MRDDLIKGHGLGRNTIITTKITVEKKMNRWARQLIPFGDVYIESPQNLESNSGHYCTIVPFLTITLYVEPLSSLRLPMYVQKRELVFSLANCSTECRVGKKERMKADMGD